MEETLFTKSQVASVLGVRPRTIGKYHRIGLIKPVAYVKNRPRYTLASILEIPEKLKMSTNG